MSQQPTFVRQVASGQPEALPAPGEMAGSLTLADLEQIALTNNPSLARAQALVAAAQGSWWQVGLPYNPAVGYLGQQLGSGGRAEQHALLVEHEFITGGKLALNRQVACQEVIRAQQQLAVQQQRVLTDVRLAFFDALLTQRRFDLANELLSVARFGQTAAKKLSEAETSRIDLIQANLELETAEIELNRAANQHTRAWRNLAAVLGVPQMRSGPLRGDVESAPINISWDQSLQRLLSTSPEVAIAVANIEKARWAVIRARAEPIPNVRFQGGVMQDNGIGGKTDGLVQVLLPLPLVNRNQGAIRQAESEAAAAEQALAQVELNLQQRLAPVYQRYSSAMNEVSRYRERILPAAQQSLDLVRRGYEGGLFPYLNLLNAQRTFFQRNVEYLESLRELHASAAEIDGLLLKDSLSASP